MMSKKVPFLFSHFSDHICYQIVTESASKEDGYHIPETQFPEKSLKVSYVLCWIEFLICECIWAGACLDVSMGTIKSPIMHYLSDLSFISRGDVLYIIHDMCILSIKNCLRQY